MSFDLSKVTHFVNKYLYSISDAKTKVDVANKVPDYPTEFAQHLRTQKIRAVQDAEADIKKVFNSVNVPDMIKENIANHNSAISGIKKHERVEPVYSSIIEGQVFTDFTNDKVSGSSASTNASNSYINYLNNLDYYNSLSRLYGNDAYLAYLYNNGSGLQSVNSLKQVYPRTSSIENAADLLERAEGGDRNAYAQSLLNAYKQYMAPSLYPTTSVLDYYL